MRVRDIFIVGLTFLVVVFCIGYSAYKSITHNDIIDNIIGGGDSDGGDPTDPGLDTDWDHNIDSLIEPPLLFHEDTANPLIGFGEVTLDWPEIDEDILSQAIVSDKGDVDLELFESIFEEQFTASGFEEALVLNDTGDNGEAELTIKFIPQGKSKIDVQVNTNRKMYNEDIITNPIYTYEFEVVTH